MSEQSRVDGFRVIVHDGREITQAEFDKLPPEQQDKAQVRTNGPHHNALWARHRRERRCLEHAFPLPRAPKKGQECVT